MVEVFKWVFIWAIIGGSIYASLNLSAFDLVRSIQSRPAKAVQVEPQSIEEKQDAAPAASSLSVPDAARPAAPAQPARFVIGNTDRAGVYMRRSKVDADKIRAWVDGSEMVEVGPREEVNGVAWRNVRDPAGNTGWIQERYLIPVTTPSAAPPVTATPVPTSVPAQAGGRVELLMTNLTRGYGFVMMEGQVRNAGAGPLHNIIAMVTLRNADGNSSRSEEQFIQSSPLAPGQVSAFKVVVTTPAEVKGYEVSFRSLLGEEITTVDLRKR